MDDLPALQGELITQPNGPTPGFKPWSPGLGKLLLADDEDGRSQARSGAVRLIAINPTLRSECERLLPALEAAKALASREEIIAVMVREMPAWGVSTKNAGEYGVTYASYADALEELPLYAVEEGVVRWNRGEGQKDVSGFPPRPAQLYALASEARRELFMAAYRARLAMEYVEEKVPTPVSEGDRARNAQAIREMLAQPRKVLPPQPPGITAADWARKCLAEGNYVEGPGPSREPRQSPQEVAQELLRASGAAARNFGAPVSRKHIEGDPGDVV